jgi:hypothetical protein
MNSEEPNQEELINFVNVFDEMDSRRGTNLLETFPHLKSTYDAGNALREAQYD